MPAALSSEDLKASCQVELFIQGMVQCLSRPSLSVSFSVSFSLEVLEADYKVDSLPGVRILCPLRPYPLIISRQVCNAHYDTIITYTVGILANSPTTWL